MRKQDIFKNIAIIFGVISLLIISLLAYAYFLRIQLENDVKLTLEEISEQTAKTINAEVKAQMALVEEIASGLCGGGEFDADGCISLLNSRMQRYPFKRAGIALADGSGIMSDGTVINLEGRQYIKKAFGGETTVSSMLTDRFDGGSVVAYAAPILEESTVRAVLFAVMDTVEFRRLLAVNTFGGEGYAYIVRSNGDGIADSEHPTSFDLTNLFDNMMGATYSNDEAVSTMRADMALGKSGCVTFYNQIDKYLYYMPLEINDWYVAHVVPVSVMSKRVNDIMQRTYIVCTAISGVLVLLACYWFGYSKKRTEQINRILYTDPVTGGLSHAKFLIDAAHSLQTTERPAAVLSIDLNNFKLVNEIFGRDTGDVLLWFVHSAMQKVLPKGSYFARGMADRFYALVYYSSTQQITEFVSVLCEYIVKKAPERFETFILKPSVGIYIVKNRKKNMQEMLNAASFARSSVKQGQHDKPYAFYTDAHRNKLLHEKRLADEIEMALKNNEFEPYFQPQYRTADKKIYGAEALMRWRKKDGTIVTPSGFIPLAEKNGFISQLDENMFYMVCRRQRELLDSGIQPVPISVNMSRQLLYDSMFIEKYIGVMQQFRLPTELIELEITETALFENQDKFLDIINELHDYGFKILMDDFGTGYSSLMMLKSIPIDIMKLDKTFVDEYNSKTGLNIIKCVTNLAKSLNISVIAEGVELEEQYNLLKDLKCDIIQGYYFSRPVPFDRFKKLLEERK